MKSDAVDLGQVRFDRQSRSLSSKDGRPVRLRNKSRAVLAYLLQSPNETVSKSDILRDVWTDVIASDESLVQCIADIRRVIGRDARKVIETVPREGYRANIEPPRSKPRKISRFPLFAVVAASVVAGVLFFQSRGPSAPQHVPAVMMADATARLPGTDDKAAFLELLQGRVSANRFSLDESLIAERHFRRAIAYDPKFARAYAELGTLFAIRFENDWSILVDADKEKALYYAQKAISLDPDLWLGHYAMGRLQSVFANLEEAERHLRIAMSLKPENEDARAYLGIILNFQGKADEAANILDQAITTHPEPPFWYFFGLGHSLFNLGEHQKAELALQRCLELAPNSPYCLRYQIAVYGELGDVAKAEAAVAAYEAMGFEGSVSAIVSLMTFHHPVDLHQLEAGLRRAGLSG